MIFYYFYSSIRKKTYTLSLILLLCIFFCSGSVSAGIDHIDNENVTIFIYHKFGEDRYPTTNVSLSRFNEQMAFLKKNSYQILPLKEVVRLLKQGLQLPDKCAVITIDDGYLSTYTGAWPILKKYGYPFTVFLYVEAVERRYRNFLTWEQIQEMFEAGVDFQDHTFSHHRLGSKTNEMGMDDYKAWIRDDLQKGRAVLTRRLGYTPKLLALPYGEYNSEIISEAKKEGYDAVFSQDPGSVSSNINIFAIPREPILGNEWASMPHFIKVLNRVDLSVNAHSPTLAPLTQTKPVKFCASLVDPLRYKPDTLGIYVSELGWNKPKLLGDNLCFDNSKTLVRRTNRVAVSGKEKESGKSAIHYWLLINPDISP